ncbi:MAG TPA: hypothetical protein VJ721_00640 [Chthoniobacterales bacterium]|nr:hypothetical protein [Chthoniobacterales bacterium]
MKEATKRSLLRWIHIVFGIVPILGYVYSPFDQIPSYASLTRYGFVPVLLLSGYWMYGGLIFAVIGVALWLGAYQLSGYGAAVVSQFALFIAWKIWRSVAARSADAQ